MNSLNRTIFVMAALVLSTIASGRAAAQDKVSVGVFPVSSSLPYFVALERGFFREQGIEPEMTKLMGGPPNVAAMMTNQIEVSAVLVTLEGLNANVKKPGVAMYISLNSQTKVWKMEQFVVRNGFKAETIADLKGRVVNCFMKCEADRRGTLRGRRQIMLDDSAVHHHRHSKAAVGGVAALAIGDPAVFVSVDAMHQGPHGGGPVIAIVELDE